MRDVRTIILAAVSRRDLCYVSENKGFRFAKNKLIHAESSFIAHRSRAHFCFMKLIPINVLVPSCSEVHVKYSALKAGRAAGPSLDLIIALQNVNLHYRHRF